AVCLDDQFIRGIEENSRDRDILKYLTEMAATCVKHINLKGIDTEAICKIVREFPITTMQGAYFSVPLTFEQMLAVSVN
ncbi:MAG: EAL domain-containing protein, partial [Blautia sp.]|nr:EAL domain-containing protein [Blautia sp.]